MSAPRPDPSEPPEGAPLAPAAYRGLQAIVAEWLQVPGDPPTAPPCDGDWVRTFRPAPAFLRYLEVRYLLGLVLTLLPAAVLLLVAAVALAGSGRPVVGALLLGLATALGVAFGLAGYYALRLRYDTTWYVMTDRAVRIRRGIWTIREHTVSYENAQNVRTSRGPIQRWLGIGDVMVETAAAGGAEGSQGGATASRAVIEGVADPTELRDRIVARMRAARSSGLGEEQRTPRAPRSSPAGTGAAAPAWSRAHLVLLQDIRDEIERARERSMRQSPD